MQLFFKKILLYSIFAFAFLVSALILSSALAKDKASKRGRGVVIDKLNLLKQTKSPKIIFIGGSNVCYGLNAQLIEDSLRIPVIDMSINADIGMVFYMNQIKPYLNSGDIVIGIPEYASYNDKNIYGNESLYGLCTVLPQNCNYLTAYQWLRILKFGGEILHDNYTAFTANKNSQISNARKFYNKWGNYEGHANKTAIADTVLAKKTAEQNFIDCNNFYKELQKMNVYCNSKGATYLHSYPVFLRTLYNANWHSIIEQNLSSIKIINQPTDFLYGIDSLYDSENHLQYKYRDIRTLKLLSNIKSHISLK